MSRLPNLQKIEIYCHASTREKRSWRDGGFRDECIAMAFYLKKYIESYGSVWGHSLDVLHHLSGAHDYDWKVREWLYQFMQWNPYRGMRFIPTCQNNAYRSYYMGDKMPWFGKGPLLCGALELFNVDRVKALLEALLAETRDDSHAASFKGKYTKEERPKEYGGTPVESVIFQKGLIYPSAIVITDDKKHVFSLDEVLAEGRERTLRQLNPFLKAVIKFTGVNGPFNIACYQGDNSGEDFYSFYTHFIARELCRLIESKELIVT
jgi:hypothetical protein